MIRRIRIETAYEVDLMIVIRLHGLTEKVATELADHLKRVIGKASAFMPDEKEVISIERIASESLSSGSPYIEVLLSGERPELPDLLHITIGCAVSNLAELDRPTSVIFSQVMCMRL